MYIISVHNISKKTCNTPGIPLHRTGVDTKNAGIDKKLTNRVGICKRSFLRHNHILHVELN